MAISLDQFIQQVVASSLISAADMNELLSTAGAEEQPKDGEQLARMLVRLGKLTAYQTQQIYSGRGQSLIMGNYVILEKLGQGGMGVVLKAEHRRMKRVVALKVLSPGVTRSPEKARRFQREVEAAARLEHANIVTAYDADEASGTHFLVMQYIEGSDLSVLVKEKGPLPVEKAVACVLQTARGLQYAHQRGVVHRDIKPANLLLDRSGTVKILDMGLARLASTGAEQDELTGTGQIMGTIDYMAPEQALDSKNADARADIYSLGVTLWYLLTGRPVYEGDSAAMKLLAHQNSAAPSLLQACPQASPQLEVIFTRMIAKLPDSRYQSMSEVIRELEVAFGTADSTPSFAPSPGEDSRLEEFLRGIRSSKGSDVAVKTAAKKIASSQATGLTVSMRSPHANTTPVAERSRVSMTATKTAGRRITQTPLRQRFSTWIFGSSLLLILLASVLFLQTKNGVIRVEIHDPQIEVAIKGTEIILKQADQGKDVKISAGEHTLIVHRGDFTFETDKLILKNGDEVTVDVKFMAGQVQVYQGETLLGQGKMPEVLTQADKAFASVAGWYGWPVDAPAPAIAPFDSRQAKRHQLAWADYLKLPAYYTNTAGMRFVLIPPGEFMMGSSEKEIKDALVEIVGRHHRIDWQDEIESEGPQHKVVLTKPFYLSQYHVTQESYRQIIEAHVSHFSSGGAGRDVVLGMDTDSHPVSIVTWSDAADYCVKLSQKENLKPFYRSGNDANELLQGDGYRLPTEAEWEFACRAGTLTRFWTGEDYGSLLQASWTKPNSSGRTHAVGELIANPFGLFDMEGNVFEWIQDWCDPKDTLISLKEPVVDPQGPPSSDKLRIARGGDWLAENFYCRTTTRLRSAAEARSEIVGFRVALATDAVKSAIEKRLSETTNVNPAWPPDAPLPACAPFAPGQAAKFQKDWAQYLGVPMTYTNKLGMAFVLIPPGEFTMGSTLREMDSESKADGEDRYWQECGMSETPQHKVILSRPFYLGTHEVTQADYTKIMGFNPSHFTSTSGGKEAAAGIDTSLHPVEMVTWYEGADLCVRISQHESLQPCYEKAGEKVTILDGNGYRLPTEAEWEYGCRAGTTTRFWNGDQDAGLLQVGWEASNSGGRTHSVGELLANPFGLYDIHGNVWEWVQDWWEPTYNCQFPELVAKDPLGPRSGVSRCVFRGGNWLHTASFCRSSRRCTNVRSIVHSGLGLRLALSVDAVKSSLARELARPTDTVWQDWPSGAPAPAIAPFIAVEAKKHQTDWADYLGVPVEYSNSLDMKFVLIPPGEFKMGALPDDLHAAFATVRKVWGENKSVDETISSELPQHNVILRHPVYVGVHEVTQFDFERVMGRNPAHFSANGAGMNAVAGTDTSRFPVETVSWNDAAEFCAKLSKMEKRQPFYLRKAETVTMLTGTGYRLPTEAEWEFFCRAGSAAKYWNSDNSGHLQRIAWFYNTSDLRPHAVGELLANPFGLLDVHGNVLEWVQDAWDPLYFQQFQVDAAIDPAGPLVTAVDRLCRGGYWRDDASFCRASKRWHLSAGSGNEAIGFRVVLVIDPKVLEGKR